MRDLNPQLPACKADTLPIELKAHTCHKGDRRYSGGGSLMTMWSSAPAKQIAETLAITALQGFSFSFDDNFGDSLTTIFVAHFCS